METKPTLKQGIKHELDQFCSHTSAHGLGQIQKSTNSLIRVAWLLFFLAGLVGISWQLSSILIGYYAYPTHEVNKMENVAVPFPDITVCNIEPLIPQLAFPLGNDPNTSVYEYGSIKLPKIRQLIADNPNSKYLKIGRISSTKGYFENQIAAESRMASHQLNDLVVGCRYAGQNCLQNKDEYFTFLADGTYYNCYTFSSTSIAPDATGVGPNVGLSILFYLDTASGGQYPGNYDALSNVKQSSGVRVTIHNKGSLSSPLNEGFDIMSGHSTAVGLSATKILCKGQPYGNCSLARSHAQLPQYKYTASACLLLHAQLHISQRCGCISVDLPVPGKLKDEIYCGFYNFSDDEYMKRIECEQVAYYEFYEVIWVSDDIHICQPACESYAYDKDISEAKWPSVRYLQSFFDNVIASRPDRKSVRAYTELLRLNGNSSNFTDSPLITDNFARLNVYFTSSDVLVRSQVASYESSNLLSDMGGTIGLWAGLSFLTVLEVIVLCGKVMALPFYKVK
ncbi:hypothetical protein CAPTEDRAFT_192431 [Capitella teleta]|uniref:Uncharacterized protein n=1 Tax=Capitella teleta TaxID=283909 RepID=R7VJ31_CAPTE|nr:hypothetical protein CAPTEDRAFT_192431 [Capitella teleta]|eukprot:ELU16321.1 hypothetical protein CAPTEDRAFT_192431 [Capitella teleta]